MFNVRRHIGRPDLPPNAPLPQPRNISVTVITPPCQVIFQHVALRERIAPDHPRQIVMPIHHRHCLQQLERAPQRSIPACPRLSHGDRPLVPAVRAPSTPTSPVPLLSRRNGLRIHHPDRGINAGRHWFQSPSSKAVSKSPTGGSTDHEQDHVGAWSRPVVEARGDPLRVGLCDCTTCRKQSGSAVTANAIFRAADVTIHGDTRTWKDHHRHPPISAQPAGRLCSASRTARSPSVSRRSSIRRRPTLCQPTSYGPAAGRSGSRWRPQPSSFQ